MLLYIKNLPPEATKNDIRALFAGFQLDCQDIFAEGKSAFLRFATAGDLFEACRLQFPKVLGQNITIQLAEDSDVGPMLDAARREKMTADQARKQDTSTKGKNDDYRQMNQAGERRNQSRNQHFETSVDYQHYKTSDQKGMRDSTAYHDVNDYGHPPHQDAYMEEMSETYENPYEPKYDKTKYLENVEEMPYVPWARAPRYSDKQYGYDPTTSLPKTSTAPSPMESRTTASRGKTSYERVREADSYAPEIPGGRYSLPPHSNRSAAAYQETAQYMAYESEMASPYSLQPSRATTLGKRKYDSYNAPPTYEDRFYGPSPVKKGSQYATGPDQYGDRWGGDHSGSSYSQGGYQDDSWENTTRKTMADMDPFTSQNRYGSQRPNGDGLMGRAPGFSERQGTRGNARGASRGSSDYFQGNNLPSSTRRGGRYAIESEPGLLPTPKPFQITKMSGGNSYGQSNRQRIGNSNIKSLMQKDIPALVPDRQKTRVRGGRGRNQPNTNKGNASQTQQDQRLKVDQAKFLVKMKYSGKVVFETILPKETSTTTFIEDVKLWISKFMPHIKLSVEPSVAKRADPGGIVRQLLTIKINESTYPCFPRMAVVSDYVCAIEHSAQKLACPACRKPHPRKGSKCSAFRTAKDKRLDKKVYIGLGRKGPLNPKANYPFTYDGVKQKSIVAAIKYLQKKEFNTAGEVPKLQLYNWIVQSKETFVDLYIKQCEQRHAVSDALKATNTSAIVYVDSDRGLGSGVLGDIDICNLKFPCLPGLNVIGKTVMKARRVLFIDTKTEEEAGKEGKGEATATKAVKEADNPNQPDSSGKTATEDANDAGMEDAPAEQQEAGTSEDWCICRTGSSVGGDDADGAMQTEAPAVSQESEPSEKATDTQPAAEKATDTPPAAETSDSPADNVEPSAPVEAVAPSSSAEKTQGTDGTADNFKEVLIDGILMDNRSKQFRKDIKDWMALHLPSARVQSKVTCDVVTDKDGAMHHVVKMNVETPLQEVFPRFAVIANIACKFTFRRQRGFCGVCRRKHGKIPPDSPEKTCTALLEKDSPQQSKMFYIVNDPKHLLSPSRVLPFVYDNSEYQSINEALKSLQCQDFMCDPTFIERQKLLTWTIRARDLLEELYRSQMAQHKKLHSALVYVTGQKQLLYISNDIVLGSGMVQSVDMKQVKEEFLLGANLIGQVLMDLRNEFQGKLDQAKKSPQEKLGK